MVKKTDQKGEKIKRSQSREKKAFASQLIAKR